MVRLMAVLPHLRDGYPYMEDLFGHRAISTSERLAEGEGFEPSIRFRIHAFQACALGQTMRPLLGCRVYKRKAK